MDMGRYQVNNYKLTLKINFSGRFSPPVKSKRKSEQHQDDGNDTRNHNSNDSSHWKGISIYTVTSYQVKEDYK